MKPLPILHPLSQLSERRYPWALYLHDLFPQKYTDQRQITHPMMFCRGQMFLDIKYSVEIFVADLKQQKNKFINMFGKTVWFYPFVVIKCVILLKGCFQEAVF